MIELSVCLSAACYLILIQSWNVSIFIQIPCESTCVCYALAYQGLYRAGDCVGVDMCWVICEEVAL